MHGLVDEQQQGTDLTAWTELRVKRRPRDDFMLQCFIMFMFCEIKCQPEQQQPNEMSYVFDVRTTQCNVLPLLT